MDDKAEVAETPDEDPRGSVETTEPDQQPARGSPITRLQEAHKQAGIAAEDLDADSDAAQYARIAGTVIEWALDELDALDDVTGQPVTDGGTAIDTSPVIGERVTYFDPDGDPHRALVTWVFGDDPGAAPMINCVRGEDFDLGGTDATGGDYGHRVTHETSVQHREELDGSAHVYVRGWSE